MTSTNLTRTEAQTRYEDIKVSHYDIDLDLTRGDTYFPSTTTVTFTAKRDCSTFIDLRAHTIRIVRLDGRDITSSAVKFTDDGVYDEAQGIVLEDLKEGTHRLTIEAEAMYSHTGQGLHRFVDPADNEVYLYTQFESADAKRMFACFDQPDLKATYSLSVTTPTGWKVIGNAPQATTDNGSSVTHRSSIDYQLSTYLVAICVGPYHEVRSTWSGKLTHFPETPTDQPDSLEIPLGIYCRKSLASHLDHEKLFTETKQGFDFYHAHFGIAYPFGKYDQVFVPEFNMGAMENAGCVTHRDEYVFTSKMAEARYERRCETILHEMAHMWFGDLVTMRWWDDLWLNESFATWAAGMSQSEATEYDTAWVTFANTEKQWAYQQDQLPSTHPISADARDIETVEQNFDGITYAKGASVLKQLQAYVGRDAFFAGVRRHFATHRFDNATFADLLESLAAASGRDLSGWAGQWLQTTGINDLTPRFTVGEDGTYSSFEVVQSGAKPGKGELRTHRTQIGLYSLNDEGKVERTFRVGHDIEGDVTPIEEIVGKKKADLVLVNDDDLTYCLMQLDEDSATFVKDNIAKITDPMARTLCWSAAWQMTRSGKMAARDYITLIANGTGTEDRSSVLEMLLIQAQIALTYYADPQWANTTGVELFTKALIEAASESPAGSDRQLLFVKALLKLRVTEASRPVFEAINNGDSPFEGLKVDNDLSWYALTGLIAAGLIDDPAAAIAKLREVDTSSQGLNYSYMADAAINTPEHKKAVFDEVTAPDCTLSNLCIRHKIMGLMRDGSTKAREGLLDTYFEVAPTTWDKQTSEMAVHTLDAVYPADSLSDHAVALADKLLAGDYSSGLKRIVSENRDRVIRAKANREVDAKAAQ